MQKLIRIEQKWTNNENVWKEECIYTNDCLYFKFLMNNLNYSKKNKF